MKKKTIGTIAVVMGLSFLALLYLQLKYMESMVKMKKEQFDESVNKALYQASHKLELNETRWFLEKDVNATERRAVRTDSVGTRTGDPDGTVQESHQYSVAGQDGTIYSSFELKTIATKPANMPKAMILRNDKNSINQVTKSMREIVKNRYVYQKALLDEVVYSILYTASEKPLRERINFKLFDLDLKAELMNNGINIPYHFTVSTQDGREVYRCPDYTDQGEEYTYSQIPSMVFTLILLVTFIITLVLAFRSKRLSEIKNDFINNMTHELKTPIASISLAAQMLNDDSVKKSEAMTKHLGGVINDESKRLRFLVEKVLQMSMFDRKNATFKKKMLDLNEIVENIGQSFKLRVEHTGGRIYTDIGAVDSSIYVDEVHFQNAINNLLDNAVKYRKPDQPIDIWLKTWNDKEKLYFSVRDNGIGIKKENLRKIFDQYYRVPTGNKHDVKGFGLGLAYVKKIVELHKGEIRADVSKENGGGTKFTISLPIIRDNV